jgi:hypothetical protein
VFVASAFSELVSSAGQFTSACPSPSSPSSNRCESPPSPSLSPSSRRPSPRLRPSAQVPCVHVNLDVRTRGPRNYWLSSPRCSGNSIGSSRRCLPQLRHWRVNFARARRTRGDNDRWTRSDTDNPIGRPGSFSILRSLPIEHVYMTPPGPPCVGKGNVGFERTLAVRGLSESPVCPSQVLLRSCPWYAVTPQP